MTKRPTILDVAKAAGVSKSTVSLVLQNAPVVKQETRDAVRRAMAEINYVYNRSAAQLRGATTGLVGLVINDLRNPYFAEFAASAQMAFNRAGYATVIANTDEDPVTQDQVIASMIEHGVTAILISPAYGGDGAGFDHLARAGTPAMQVLRQVDDRADLFPFASPDNAAGGALAAQHMIDVGCENIAFVGGLADRGATLERQQGYERAMQEAGRPVRVFHGRPSRAFGRQIAMALRQDHPDIDGAVCFNDLVALGMLSGLAEQSVDIGRAFRVIGFDDIEECSVVYPGLSSIHCGISAFGRQAAEAILSWVDEGTPPAMERKTPVHLVTRASTQPKTL